MNFRHHVRPPTGCAAQVVALLLGLFLCTNAMSESRLATGGERLGTNSCPGYGYDDGTSEDSIFFGGGNAGDPQYILGVKFELADFGFEPGLVALTGFCVANSFAFAGGPWPNEIFVYPDDDGLPNLNIVRAQATVSTGDGTGPVQIVFAEPVVLGGTFWIMVRGDPMHAGEDFNLEIDLSSEPTGNSYLTDFGLVLLHQTGGNWSIRAALQGLPPPLPVPAASKTGWYLLLLAFALTGCWRQFSKSNARKNKL